MNSEEEIVSYREITIAVDPLIEESVCNFVIEHVTSGLLLEDEDGSDKIRIKFYLPDDENGEFDSVLLSFVRQTAENFHVELPTISESVVANRSWEDEYRKSVRPVEIGEEIIVRPTWDRAASNHPYQIMIEPKMAFGTGTHETTRSSLLAITEHFETGMTFLDVGCGSGILSILADKMGATYIKAIDYDEIAVANCLENFQINAVSTKYDILCGTISICNGDSPYDFVCANIIRKTILEIMEELDRLTASRGRLLLSGLLDIDLEEALKRRGLTDYQVHPDNEWRTVVAYKG